MRHKRSKKNRRTLPEWDNVVHTLFLGGRAVKHFRSLAPQQEGIIEAFHNAGWPPCLLTSLLPPQIRSHLRSSVQALNRSVRPLLHFRLEGKTSRLVWESGVRKS